jgi:hypothetical protein
MMRKVRSRAVPPCPPMSACFSARSSPSRLLPMRCATVVGIATFAWILFRPQGRPLPGQRRYVAHRQRRSDADRLDTVVDPVKRHSLPPRFASKCRESLRKCSETQIVTEPTAHGSRRRGPIAMTLWATARVERKIRSVAPSVEQRTLTPSILVRIQVPQPRILPKVPRIFGFGNCCNSHGISVG